MGVSNNLVLQVMPSSRGGAAPTYLRAAGRDGLVIISVNLAICRSNINVFVVTCAC